MNHLLLLAQATPPADPAQGSPLGMLVPFICIGVIFYFLIIRPQSKRQKEQDTMTKSLKTGDKVVTAGGIHGLISNLKDTTVVVKIADNVKVEIDRSAIARVIKETSAK